ncbi:MAG: FtsQ-type POTRA domain-containing protein [Propionibacteriaceae bacterium]|nr:FtsQ-type POTRA domain-containing protein [Propionibacteriaceae bacterium]
MSGPGAVVREWGPSRRRQQWQRRRRRLRLALVVGAVLALGLAGAWLAFLSPVFAADRVEVTGTDDPAVQEQVVGAAAVPLGQPLLRLDVDAIAQRAAQTPAVAQVEVRRHWDGVVELALTMRSPAYVLVSHGSYVLVDASGRDYQTVASPPLGLIPATLAQTSPRDLSDVARVVTALPETVRRQTRSIESQSVDHIEIRLESGAAIMWGSADQSELKAEVMAGLINLAASYYDVSSPSHPATR